MNRIGRIDYDVQDCSNDPAVAAVIRASQSLPNPDTYEHQQVHVPLAESLRIDRSGERPDRARIVVLTFERRRFREGQRDFYLWECPEHMPLRYFGASPEPALLNR